MSNSAPSSSKLQASPTSLLQLWQSSIRMIKKYVQGWADITESTTPHLVTAINSMLLLRDYALLLRGNNHNEDDDLDEGNVTQVVEADQEGSQAIKGLESGIHKLAKVHSGMLQILTNIRTMVYALDRERSAERGEPGHRVYFGTMASMDMLTMLDELISMHTKDFLLKKTILHCLRKEREPDMHRTTLSQYILAWRDAAHITASRRDYILAAFEAEASCGIVANCIESVSRGSKTVSVGLRPGAPGPDANPRPSAAINFLLS